MQHERSGRPDPDLRPGAEELEAALMAHRENPGDVEVRNALLVLLYRCVALQARESMARQFQALAHREDELVLRTLARIEGTQGSTPSDAPGQPQLLADYALRPGARSIYNYVLQKTINIARNMQVEAYVPDGGFWSADLKARFKAVRLQDAGGGASLQSGVQIDVPAFSPDDDNDSYEHADTTSPSMQMSETPMRQSVLRVNSLARGLDALAHDMVGKTVAVVHGEQTEPVQVRLTVNHQRVWRAWLGLSHPELIDLGEEDLAAALGVSKASVTRDTSVAFAYMLGHPQLRSLLVLMEPNRFQSSAAAAKGTDAKLDDLERALRERNGKSFFRKCVHQWLGEHV